MSHTQTPTVPLTPSGLSNKAIFIPYHVPSSKNSRVKTRNGNFIVSKAVRNYRKWSKPYWKKERDKFKALIKARKEPIKVGFHFIRKTTHKYDWVNPLQTVQDEMVKHNWITDDSIDLIVPMPFRLNGSFTTVDKRYQGVIIKIIS